MKKVIGLTGGTGSGKSVVSDYLRQKRGFIIDADRIGHEIIKRGQPAYDEIIDHFGKGILDLSGEIVRKNLGAIVFQNQQELAFLNECTHKYIKQEILRQIALGRQDGQSRFMVLDAALLFEVALEYFCDSVWVVLADKEVQLQRIMARDGLCREIAHARINSQMKKEEYAAKAQILLDNSKDLPWLYGQIDTALKKITD